MVIPTFVALAVPHHSWEQRYPFTCCSAAAFKRIHENDCCGSRLSPSAAVAHAYPHGVMMLCQGPQDHLQA